MKFLIITLLAATLAVSICAFDIGFGEQQDGDELIWVQHKFTPIFGKKQESLSLTFSYQEKNRVDRISWISFDSETDAESTSGNLVKGGPDHDFSEVTLQCRNCSYFQATQKIYGHKIARNKKPF